MKIIPVLDLRGGQVVRGVAGRRQEYRPIVSTLVQTSVPLCVARAVRDHFGLCDLYLADLDAIAGQAAAIGTFTALRADGFRLWVDAGIRTDRDARPLIDIGVESIVVGLETVAGPDVLGQLCDELGQRIVFSLDLKDGQPLVASSDWQAADAWSVALEAIACGIRRLIVLDLARVGLAEGTGTETLCRRLSESFPELELVAGGGVRSLDDLRRLQQCGVNGALVASALHEGWLTRKNLEMLGQRP
jgi:phosphoribosylformimino-5-aminoimidazole carboxamide ribotide isomerase